MSAQSGSSLAQVFNPLVVGDNTENSGVWLLTIIKKKKKRLELGAAKVFRKSM